MDQNNQINQSAPQMESPLSGLPKHEKKVGPIVVTLVIIVALVVTAVYIFATGMNTDEGVTANQTAPSTDATLNTETDLTGLENELNSLNVDLEAENF